MALFLAPCHGIYLSDNGLQTLTNSDGVEIVTQASSSSVDTYVDACGLCWDSTVFNVLKKNDRNPVITDASVTDYPTETIEGVCCGVKFDENYFGLTGDGAIDYPFGTTKPFLIVNGQELSSVFDIAVGTNNSFNTYCTDTSGLSVNNIPYGYQLTILYGGNSTPTTLTFLDTNDDGTISYQIGSNQVAKAKYVLLEMVVNSFGTLDSLQIGLASSTSFTNHYIIKSSDLANNTVVYKNIEVGTTAKLYLVGADGATTISTPTAASDDADDTTTESTTTESTDTDTTATETTDTEADK